jgi:histidinol-phosphatase (PHP family)
MQTFLRMGGGFVLSDDCHSVEQVGLNYNRVFEAIEKAGITDLFYCRLVDKAEDESHGLVEFVPTAVSTIEGWS